MVFAENVLSMQTLSVETGTVPPLQFEGVAQELSPAVPVHCLVPVAQAATAGALQKAVHDIKTSMQSNVFMWSSPKHQSQECEKLRLGPVWPAGRGRVRKRHIVLPEGICVKAKFRGDLQGRVQLFSYCETAQLAKYLITTASPSG